MSDPLIDEILHDECQPLLDRLVKKLQRGERLRGAIRLTNLQDGQRVRIQELTGSVSRGSHVSIDLAAFDSIVRNTRRFESLDDLVIAAVGPIDNRRARNEAHTNAWSDVWSRAIDQAGNNEPLIRCFESLRRHGWLTKAANRDPAIGSELLATAIRLFERLPVSPTPLAIFAADQMGDAHALDATRPLCRLLLRMIASRVSNSSINTLLNSAAKRHELWESVGIVPDELSASVLVLNLPTATASLSDRVLADHRSHGIPCRLTFRHLRVAPPTFLSPATGHGKNGDLIHVCENPSVIAAAADLHGNRCKPIVCVEGNPNLACLHLLSGLTDIGYRLAYHGDFDWGGIRIANRIYRKFGFQPWRFGGSDHRVVSANHRPLRPPPASADWDPELAPLIAACGVVVEEESVIDELVADLAREY